MALFESKIPILYNNIKVLPWYPFSLGDVDFIPDKVVVSMNLELEFAVFVGVRDKHLDQPIHVSIMGAFLVYSDYLRQL